MTSWSEKVAQLVIVLIFICVGMPLVAAFTRLSLWILGAGCP